MRQIFIVIGLVLSSLTAQVQATEPDAMSLLARMSTAAKTLNYEGVFLCQSGQRVQSIKIIHRFDDNGEHERLVSLDGPPREIVRHDQNITFVKPKSKRAATGRKSGFPSDLLRGLRSAAPYYKMQVGDVGRVADRITQKVMIKPIDNFRYGLHLWVDKETNLLLQSSLLNAAGESLETFAFSSVKFLSQIPDAALAPSRAEITLDVMPKMVQRERAMKPMQTEAASVMEMADGIAVPPSPSPSPSPWQVAWLPDGFALIAQDRRQNTPQRPALEHRVYSDGLNAISIFFEKMRAQHGHLQGGTNRGAVNAFGTISHGNFVTVVGEVPQRTVEKVGESIRHQAAAE